MGVSTVTGSAARRRELGRCLRAYRDLVRPRQVGLAESGRRRAPGLRREEVATLAGVGVTWYTWLEQGRVAASDQVIDAVGRVLGIDDAGRGHLRALSGVPSSCALDPGSLLPVLASWPSDPAALLDARLDVVEVNQAWAATWGRPVGDHVLSALVDQRVDDLGPLVHALARRLRMAANCDPGDERLARVRADLRAAAPWYAALWECRGVGAFGRPRVRVDGIEREAHLLGEAPPVPRAGPAVLVLLPGSTPIVRGHAPQEAVRHAHT